MDIACQSIGRRTGNRRNVAAVMVREQHAPDCLFELTDVSRPLVALESRYRLFGQVKRNAEEHAE